MEHKINKPKLAQLFRTTLIIVSVLWGTSTLSAQNIGINTETPHASAMLDIESGDMGLLIPRINIASLSSANPVATPATGLLVYNTNTSTGPGFFYWNGSIWVSLFSRTEYNATPAGGISNESITNWNTAYGWGNHATAGYSMSSHSHQTLTRGTYLTGSNYNGSAATTWAVDASSANNASKIVARDASGNFSAGNITSTNMDVYNTGNTGWAGYTSYRNAATGASGGDGVIVGLNGSNLWINNYENSTIYFGTQNTSRMAISGAGNVGIGVDVPTQKLDVAGNIKTTGHLYTNGAASNYGAISFYGAKGGYGGINFRDAAGTNIATLMIHSTYQGVYNSTDNGWLWYWNNGTLEVGTVPWARLSGVPTSFTPATHSHSATDITSGTLPVARGGTGATTFTSGNILTGNGTGAILSTLTYSAAASNSTIVQRNASGYVFANYFNTTANVTATAASHFAVQTGSDNYIRWQTPANARTSLGLGGSATLNVGTTAGTVAAGNHTHANATSSTDGFMSAADKTKLDGIRKGSFVITKINDGWHQVTHNWNISNINWYAAAVNGDKAANNSSVLYECAWRDANSCWVYLSGPNGAIRINIVAF